MKSHNVDGAVAPSKKPWGKPEVRRIMAGSAENGSNPTTNGDAPSSGAKSWTDRVVRPVPNWPPLIKQSYKGRISLTAIAAQGGSVTTV